MQTTNFKIRRGIRDKVQAVSGGMEIFTNIF
jgi:hypothetical protein